MDQHLNLKYRKQKKQTMNLDKLLLSIFLHSVRFIIFLDLSSYEYDSSFESYKIRMDFFFFFSDFYHPLLVSLLGIFVEGVDPKPAIDFHGVCRTFKTFKTLIFWRKPWYMNFLHPKCFIGLFYIHVTTFRSLEIEVE